MRRRRTVLWCLFWLVLLGSYGYGQAIPANRKAGDGLAIQGPDEIEPGGDEYYDVVGLEAADIPHAKVFYFPEEGVRIRTALPWGGGPPYISFRAKQAGLYRLWVIIDHPPKPPENAGGIGSSREPWIHVPDEHAWIDIQVGEPPPPPDPPTIKVGDVEAGEGAGQASFGVQLSKPAPADVSFSYATQDGSAEAGSDYRETVGSAAIAAGGTSTAVSVPILDDSASEQSENFSLALTNIRNAVPSGLIAVCTITDNDAPPITKLYGVIVFDPDDEDQQDPVWSQIMFGPYFNRMLGDREWQPVADDLSGAPPDWLSTLVDRTKQEGLQEPHLWLLNQDRSVVWNGQLPKTIEATEDIVREWVP